MPQGILIVEDDPDLARLLARLIERMGLDPVVCDTLESAEVALSAHQPALIVLDRLLPDGEGVAWLADYRGRGGRVPVLVLSALDETFQRIEGLDQGADDYLGKPFSIEELQARIRALLRRQGVTEAGIRVGQLVLDTGEGAACWRGRPVALTPRELAVLRQLMAQPDQLVSKQALLERVWGTRFEGYEHAVNVTINRLRSKLKAAGAPETLIETRWRQGYRLNTAAAEAGA